MKTRLCLLFIALVLWNASVFADDITLIGNFTTTQTFSSNNQTLTLGVPNPAPGDRSSIMAIYGPGIYDIGGRGLSIQVNKGSVISGSAIIGKNYSAIRSEGNSQINTINIDSGTVQSYDETYGTIFLGNPNASTTINTIGSGSIQNNRSDLKGYAINSYASNLTINNGGVISVKYGGTAINISSGSLFFKNNFAIQGNINAAASNYSLVVNDGFMIDTNIDLGTGTSSQFVNNDTYVGDVIRMGNSTQSIIANGGSFDAYHNGIPVGILGTGMFVVNSNNNLAIQIGDTNSNINLIINNGYEFVDRTTTYAAARLGQESILTIKNNFIGNIYGSFNNHSDLTVGGLYDGSYKVYKNGVVDSSSGTVNIETNLTLSGVLGSSDHMLDTINIKDGYVLNTSKYQVAANKINLGNNSVLNIGSGNVNVGDVDGSSPYTGTVNFDNTIFLNNNNLTFGSTNGLKQISNNSSTLRISNGQTLTTNASSTYLGNVTLSGTLNINDGTLYGNVDGDGSANGSGVVNFNGNSTIDTNTHLGSNFLLSQVNVNNGSLNINGSIRASTIKTTSDSSLILNQDGVMNIGFEQNNINGTLIINDGSVISVSSSPSGFGQLRAKSVVYSPNFKLAVNIPNNQRITTDTQNIIIQSTSPTSASIDNDLSSLIYINGSNSNRFGLLLFAASQSGGNLLLTTKKISASAITSDISAQNIYNQIDANQTGKMADFFNYLNNNSITDKQREDALKSALPQSDNGLHQTIFNNANTVFSAIGSRLETLHRNQKIEKIIPEKNKKYKLVRAKTPRQAKMLVKNTSDDQENVVVKDSKPNYSLWGQTFSNSINQGNLQDVYGYKTESNGFIIGADGKISKDVNIGAAINYNISKVQSLEGLKNTNIDTYQINLYAGKNFGKYFLNGIAGIAQNQYSSNKNISVINTNSTAKYSGQSYLAKIETGMTQKFQSGLDITPKLGITFINNKIDQRKEQGADTMDLTVNASKNNSIEARSGVDLGYNIKTKKDISIRPKLNASYGYDIAGNPEYNTASFSDSNSSFQYKTFTPNRSSTNFGGGVDIYKADSLSISGEYEITKRSQQTSNSAMIKLQYRF